jgi:hypothetical protein
MITPASLPNDVARANLGETGCEQVRGGEPEFADRLDNHRRLIRGIRIGMMFSLPLWGVIFALAILFRG